MASSKLQLYLNINLTSHENIKANLILLKVLQKQLDLELELYGDVKEKTSVNAIGKIYVVSLSSQPVDHEESTDCRQKVRPTSILQYYRNFDKMYFHCQTMPYQMQLEILRRAGAMPISSRRCGMITKREAERLCKSFLGDNSPPKLPENFAFEVSLF